MANGKTLEEIKALVASGDISSKAARQLQLTLQIETYELIQTIDGRLLHVEMNSWGVWARKHPRLFILLCVAFAAVFISDFRQPLLSYITGLRFVP